MTNSIKPPFPYFGGKRRVAAEVWRRFGDVKSYVEPFFGSGAVLLGRPNMPGLYQPETVNDADGLLCNFWRAMVYQPDEVALHADWPVNEADLHARHAWLNGARESVTERLIADPQWCDPMLAGWWVWGASCWIGGGWCGGDGHRRLISVGDHGRGVNRPSPGGVADWLAPVAARLRRVRVACGDWSRVCGPSAIRPGDRSNYLAGIFLDPPYGEGRIDYATGGSASTSIADDVWAWAVEHGENPMTRICVAGYEDGREVPDGWSVYRWKTRGGYGNQGHGAGRKNAKRETLWFSPGCLNPDNSDRGLL